MPKPFRLAVMEALRDGLRVRIDGSGSYTHNLTQSAHFGLSAYGSNDALPLANIIEDPREQPTEQTTVPGRGHKVSWKLVFQGFASHDETSPAYTLAADLMVAVADMAVEAETDDASVLSRSRKTNRVEQIKIGAPIVRPPDEFSDKAYCLLPVTLDLFETPSSPFT